MATRQFSVCVFCGSRTGISPEYVLSAAELGLGIANENWRLVYGAGDTGLMGAVAKSAQNAGGNTFGVIPAHLFDQEEARQDLGTLVVTENMHERKKIMFMNSDAVVVLPGGAGSLDEFFEVLTWRQLKLHNKPIFILNQGGYWAKLINLIDHIISQGFADESLRTFLTISDNVPELLTAIGSAKKTADLKK